MLFRFCAAALAAAVSCSAQAALTCQDVLKKLGDQLEAVTCFQSADLTTNGSQTTPADNSIGLPTGAFTPTTDRSVISPDAPDRTPITKQVRGLQIQARIKSDALGQARFLLRLPADWNGRLVVAGASGNRSEFNGDYAWSDFVVQQGYAYASQNKGMYNLQIVGFLPPAPPPSDPLACRLNPDSPFPGGTQLWVHFYANDPGVSFTRWTEFMVKAAELAHEGVKAAFGRPPRYTYAVGTSNGGYQVRRAVEVAPKLFDGGVDWEGTFVDEHAPNLLTDLPAAVLNFPDYRAAFNSNPDTAKDSTAAKNIVAAGYPPDIASNIGTTPTTLWTQNWSSFWEVTLCQWQKRLDPGYDTYGSGTGTYNYVSRLSKSNVGQEMAAFATTGKIQRPLITVAGTTDALLPIDHHARAYARKVEAAARANVGRRERPAYRLYEVQNGTHIENYKQRFFSELEFTQPHAHEAFNLLVDHVERGMTLPPSQCVPRGGAISNTATTQRGHCAELYVE